MTTILKATVEHCIVALQKEKEPGTVIYSTL